MTPLPPGSRTVLLVDPDDDSRELYAHAFTAAHWHADDAESGPIALAKALHETPALVVTELRLAGIDGYDLIRMLRRDPGTSHLPIIVVAAEAVPSTLERAHTAGADLVLSKPCLPDVLVARANELVASREPAGDPQRLDGLRATTTPPARVFTPACPTCGTSLSYSHAHATRVGRRAEQWLHYRCPNGCGRYEYRERTRKLRKIS